MASPAEIVRHLPETLPEDFNDWDGEAPQSPAQAALAAAISSRPLGSSADTEEAAGHITPRQRENPASFEAMLERMAEKPRVLRTANADVEPVEGPRGVHSGNEMASAASEVSSARKEAVAVPAANKWNEFTKSEGTRQTSELRATIGDADAVLFESAYLAVEPEEESQADHKKWIFIGAGALVAVLLAVFFFMHGHSAKAAAAKLPAQPVPAVTAPQQVAVEPAAQLESRPSAEKVSESSTSQPAAEAAPQQKTPAVSAEQAALMNDQLAAPTRIPRKQASDDAAPSGSFLAASADSFGGSAANTGLFSGSSQAPKVAPGKPITISSGVATGMLIQKSAPLYPTIAKQARVSGTVVMHAIISKTGSIKDLAVESGPQMLRQSALDAVRTWRYKPYLLNNEPVEVETTINMIFTLGN